MKIIKQVKTIEIHTINTAQEHKHCTAMLSLRVATLLIFILSMVSPKPAKHLLIETDDGKVASTDENIAGYQVNSDFKA